VAGTRIVDTDALFSVDPATCRSIKRAPAPDFSQAGVVTISQASPSTTGDGVGRPACSRPGIGLVRNRWIA